MYMKGDVYKGVEVERNSPAAMHHKEIYVM